MPNRAQTTFLKPAVIMVFGTFDIVHEGHLYFFREARKLSENPFLIVSIARDVNVIRIKGKRPLYKERARAKHVLKTGLVDKVILGGLKDHMRHILKESPKIIALGYDQAGSYVEETVKYIKENGLDIRIRRLKPFHPNKYKSSLLRKFLS